MKKEKAQLMYGNKDSKQEKEMNVLSKNKYFVRHSRVEKTTTGFTIEDPGSIRYQYYDIEFWDRFVNVPRENGGVDLLTQVSGETITILHDPTIQDEEKPKRTRRGKTEDETEL